MSKEWREASDLRSSLLGVVLVHRIGMRWGARHALLAAGLMAVAPLHVAASREIGGASLVTFFAALGLLLSIASTEQHDRSLIVSTAMAGAAAGLAAASEYAGAVTIVMPLVAIWMTRRDDSSRAVRATVAITAALVAFAIAVPLSVRDLPAF